MNITNYDIKLNQGKDENDSPILVLTKKNIEANPDAKPPVLRQGIQTFDDGLFF